MNYLWDNLFRKKKREDDTLSALRENFLFQDLSERDLRFIEGIVHIRRYHAGEMVFRQGEVGVGMYIIVSGRVEIYITDRESLHEENREIFITQLLAGDFFGELSLVEENGRRTASACAREETVLIGFFKPDLMEILARNPDVGIKITFKLAEVLGRRLKETTDKVSELRQALKELREPPPLDKS
ncbi:MAG TPA: cyclic nucleotide-binding domain-containing protein [Bdellovibrionales bacterium]|nr:cyclic nucleotide-binding domain-containing protein [Bdellovibrionales bacterium]